MERREIPLTNHQEWQNDIAEHSEEEKQLVEQGYKLFFQALLSPNLEFEPKKIGTLLKNLILIFKDLNLENLINKS